MSRLARLSRSRSKEGCRGSFSAWTDQTARSLGRDGIVAKIKVKPGDSLNVDAVILEFK